MTRTVGLLVALAWTAAAIMAIRGITFPLQDALWPAALVLLFTGGTRLCPLQSVKLLFKALAVALVIATVYPTAMYTVATLGAPYADETLSRCDMGIAVWAFRTAEQSPIVSAILLGVYNLVIPETLIIILFLSATKEQRRLETFLYRFVLGLCITLICFAVCPAKGTVAAGLPTPEDYQPILMTLDQLRAGVSSISCQGSLGLITFPSFHAIWAILLVVTFRRHALFVPMLILNGIMVWSTMTTGMHYAADVVVGLIICGIIIPATSTEGLALNKTVRRFNLAVDLHQLHGSVA